MDNKAFFKLSYGLYIVSTTFEGQNAACVINTAQQITSSPEQLSITINKENFTQQMIAKSGVFTLSVISENIDIDVIRAFGFKTSKEFDKFQGQTFEKDQRQVPYLTQGMSAMFSCEVVKSMDVGTHIIYAGKVIDAKVLSDNNMMTYAYYHQVKNGTTPPKASSYQQEASVKGWRCKICSHVYEGENLPDGFTCPVCGQPASVFERIG